MFNSFVQARKYSLRLIKSESKFQIFQKFSPTNKIKQFNVAIYKFQKLIWCYNSYKISKTNSFYKKNLKKNLIKFTFRYNTNYSPIPINGDSNFSCFRNSISCLRQHYFI